jgi:hypothetical protein
MEKCWEFSNTSENAELAFNSIECMHLDHNQLLEAFQHENSIDITICLLKRVKSSNWLCPDFFVEFFTGDTRHG